MKQEIELQKYIVCSAYKIFVYRIANIGIFWEWRKNIFAHPQNKSKTYHVSLVQSIQSMRILHLAIENFAGIPIRLVKEERRLGHDSRLITLLSPMQNYEEDIALRLPALNAPFVPLLRNIIRLGHTPNIINKRHEGTVKYWKPANALDAALFRLRDWYWQPSIHAALQQIGGLNSFDLIFADGGHDFTRFPQLLAETPVPIVSMYYGSDMRTRGIITGVQEKARATFTFEHDHTLLFPEAQFLFYPYEAPVYAPSRSYLPPQEGETLRIGHAPTNRAAKGTDLILSALESLRDEFPIEIILIEKLPHPQAMAAKARCHAFIDSIGEIGYGVNSIESLLMGIPTAVEIMPDFALFLQEQCAGEAHPFFNIRRANLREDIRAMLLARQNWSGVGEYGASWAARHHSLQGVVARYMQSVLAVI